MAQSVVERTAEHIAESAHQASRATSAIADVIEDGVNDSTQRLQRHPLLTIATTFAVGFTAGTLIGWMLKRR